MVKQSRLTNLRWEIYNEVDDGGKVGAFTIIGIVLFIAGILFVGRIDIWAKPQMTITGDFTQVNGLKNGNQVKFSGVAIGTVSDIEITPRGVVVKMKLDEKTQIPSDSIFSLGSDGFLGDKFIQISPGQSKYIYKMVTPLKVKALMLWIRPCRVHKN